MRRTLPSASQASITTAGRDPRKASQPVTLVIRSKDAIAADLVRDLGIELHRPEDLQQWAQEYARAYGLQVIEAFGSALIPRLPTRRRSLFPT